MSTADDVYKAASETQFDLEAARVEFRKGQEMVEKGLARMAAANHMTNDSATDVTRDLKILAQAPDFSLTRGEDLDKKSEVAVLAPPKKRAKSEAVTQSNLAAAGLLSEEEEFEQPRGRISKRKAR